MGTTKLNNKSYNNFLHKVLHKNKSFLSKANDNSDSVQQYSLI